MPISTNSWSGGEVPLMHINRHADSARDGHDEMQAQTFEYRHFLRAFFLPALAGAFGLPPFFGFGFVVRNFRTTF